MKIHASALVLRKYDNSESGQEFNKIRSQIVHPYVHTKLFHSGFENVNDGRYLYIWDASNDEVHCCDLNDDEVINSFLNRKES